MPGAEISCLIVLSSEWGREEDNPHCSGWDLPCTRREIISIDLIESMRRMDRHQSVILSPSNEATERLGRGWLTSLSSSIIDTGEMKLRLNNLTWWLWGNRDPTKPNINFRLQTVLGRLFLVLEEYRLHPSSSLLQHSSWHWRCSSVVYSHWPLCAPSASLSNGRRRLLIWSTLSILRQETFPRDGVSMKTQFGA